jgi:hypothetical protein
MRRQVRGGEEFRKLVEKAVGKDKADSFLDSLPDFNETYEAWYSEALALIRQTLPDRVGNFVSLYEKPKGRKNIENGNYVMQDFLQGLTVSQYDRVVVALSAALPQYQQQLAILKAARARFKSSLFEIAQIVQADLFDKELDAARALLKSRFLRAAGVVSGVVLEGHLLQVCTDHGIKPARKNLHISDLNEALKAASVIDVPQWRHISMLGDIRNLCSHKTQADPTAEQVLDLINGTDKVLKTIV